MTAVKTAFERIHTLLRVDPEPGREEHFFADAESLFKSELELAVFGVLSPEVTDLAFTVALPVDASPEILAAVQENPGVLNKEVKDRIHAAIVDHVRNVTGTKLNVSVRHSLLAPREGSPVMPVALNAA